MLRNNKTSYHEIVSLDTDMLVRYIKAASPLLVGTQDRIKLRPPACNAVTSAASGLGESMRTQLEIGSAMLGILLWFMYLIHETFT